jgi:hypothetical protein
MWKKYYFLGGFYEKGLPNRVRRFDHRNGCGYRVHIGG